MQAAAFTEANIVDVGSYEELKAAVAERKWARGAWAGMRPMPCTCATSHLGNIWKVDFCCGH